MLNTDISTYEFHYIDLKTAVMSLPKSQQELIIWHLMGLTVREMAEIKGMSFQAIWKQLNKIKLIIEKIMIDKN